MPYIGHEDRLPTTLTASAAAELNRLWRLRPLIRITLSHGPPRQETSIPIERKTSAASAATNSGPKTPSSTVGERADDAGRSAR